MPRPSKFPRWADLAAPADVVEPPESRKDSGWLAGERPPAPMFNWLGRTGNEWIVWLDAESQRLSTAAAAVAGQISGAVNGLKAAANTWAAIQTFTSALVMNAGGSVNGADLSMLGGSRVYKQHGPGANGGYTQLWRMNINSVEQNLAEIGLYASDDLTQFPSDSVTSSVAVMLVIGATWDGSNWQSQMSGVLGGTASCIALRKNGGLYRGYRAADTFRTFALTQVVAPGA